MEKRLGDYLLRVEEAGKTMHDMYHAYVFGRYEDSDLRQLLSKLADFDEGASEDIAVYIDDVTEKRFEELLEA